MEEKEEYDKQIENAVENIYNTYKTLLGNLSDEGQENLKSIIRNAYLKGISDAQKRVKNMIEN